MPTVETPSLVRIDGFRKFVSPLGLPKRMEDYGGRSQKELFQAFEEAFEETTRHLDGSYDYKNYETEIGYVGVHLAYSSDSTRGAQRNRFSLGLSASNGERLGDRLLQDGVTFVALDTVYPMRGGQGEREFQVGIDLTREVPTLPNLATGMGITPENFAGYTNDPGRSAVDTQRNHLFVRDELTARAFGIGIKVLEHLTPGMLAKAPH